MPRRSKVNRLDYCQYLLSTHTNFTLTYCSEHMENISHDAFNRYLRDEKLSPRILWEHIKKSIVYSDHGYIVFDDTIMDKSHATSIEICRYQYSGNAKKVIYGIGVVNAIYVNPDTQQYWIIDYRIYNPEQDGNSKLDHVRDMLRNIIFYKKIPCRAVLMDTWYATHQMMLTIDTWGKLFYCPIKKNRLVRDVQDGYHHIPVDQLPWNKESLSKGRTIHLNKFPDNFHVQLFRITVSTHRTDFVVTNDNTQPTSEVVQQVYKFRWCVEQFHREAKQLTGVEKCQCRKQRIQRNHIACAYLVWLKLKNVAQETCQTIYQVKNNLLRQYMFAELKSPQIKFDFA